MALPVAVVPVLRTGLLLAAVFGSEAGCGSPNPAVAGPTAVLTVASTSVAVGEVDSFDASRSLGSELLFTLAYGDGTHDGPQSNPSFHHAYSKYGTLTATLTAVDRQTRTAADSKSITVKAGLVARGVVIIDGQPDDLLCDRPTTKQTALRDGSTVMVDASCSSGSGLSYTVAWGDGTTTGPQSASSIGGHRYTSIGTFAVSLTVKDSSGAFQAASVGSVPVVDFSGRWANTIFNQSTNRIETRYLQLVQGARGTISGTYTHPEGGSEPLTGSIVGERGIDLRLTSGTLTMNGDDTDASNSTRQVGLSSDGKTFTVEVSGGSADGLFLTFSRL